VSCTEKLLRQLLAALAERAVEGEIVRAVDFNVKPGVGSDEVERDVWPDLRRRIHARQDQRSDL
jgi:multimeric flavodoxin WrbA